MTKTFFADSGHWIALLNARDQMHEKAKAVEARLGPVTVVTTQMALAEVLNHLSGEGNRLRNLAVQMARELQDNPNVEIVPQTDAQFEAAVERYRARGDQRWSLTDCASFLVMEERNINEALAYDRDFEQAGFVALLRGSLYDDFITNLGS